MAAVTQEKIFFKYKEEARVELKKMCAASTTSLLPNEQCEILNSDHNQTQDITPPLG
jgi:hypothetical protein